MPKEKPGPGVEAPKKKRRRRSTDQIIDLLIEAACDEFERNGYDGAKTATIAKNAGVAEALIFSNFGSKAKLFHDSIFKPLDQNFGQFYVTHPVAPDDLEGRRRATRQYILELQQFIKQHSRMLKSVVAAQMYAGEGAQDLSQIAGLHAFFSAGAASPMNRALENPKIDPKLIVRISFATILACVIFKEWLFPEGLASNNELGIAISDFVMEGLAANAEAQSRAKSVDRSRRSPVVAKPKKKS